MPRRSGTAGGRYRRWWRRVATHNGKVYGIPECSRSYMGVVFRSDLVRAAGLDANSSATDLGRADLLVPEAHGSAAGGSRSRPAPGPARHRAAAARVHLAALDAVSRRQPDRSDPPLAHDGTGLRVRAEATRFVTPDGENLERVEPRWRANFASPEGVAAVGLYHRLRWEKWLIDPQTHEPVTLTDADVAQRWWPWGERRVTFHGRGGRHGGRPHHDEQRGDGMWELLGRGEWRWSPGLSRI